MERPDLGISPLIKQSRSGLARFWRDGSRQAKQDWLSSWRGLVVWFSWICWLACLCTSLSFLDLYSKFSRPGTTLSACQPDGKFAADPSHFRYWSSSGFFQVSLGFGHLDFTQAKTIDIIWDVMVGRGGQAILAFVSWRVFANYVTTSMEVAPITFRTYRTIFLQNESSLLFSIPRMIRDFTLRRRLQSKLAMVFMVMTMSFILVFPTWASAMTGYSGNQQAHVTMEDKNLVPFESLRFALFIIHDGGRISKDDNYVVTTEKPSDGDPISTESQDGPSYAVNVDCYREDSCDILGNVTMYVQEFGFHGRNATTSTFMGRNLTSPVLNISAVFIPDSLYRVARPASLDRVTLEPFENQQVTWTYQNTLYTREDIKKAGRCQPLLDYQWGFSFIQLFLMLITLILWTCGIFLMWLHTYMMMKRRGHRAVPGEYKALFELTDAIQNQLSDYGKEEAEDVKCLPDSEMRRRITKDLRGGSIAYESTILSLSSLREQLKLWTIEEKWWILGFWVAVSAMCANTVHILESSVVFAIGSPLEVVVAVYTGTTNKSRAIIFFWAFMIMSMIPQIVLSILFGMYS